MQESAAMLPSNQIDHEAAHWAVRLAAGALTAEEQTELDRWLEANPRHQGALLRARAAWTDLDRLAALAGSGDPLSPKPVDSVPASGSGVIVDQETLAPTELPASPRAAAPRGAPALTRRKVLAAGVTAVTLGAATLWWLRRHGETYVSGVGEIRRVTLPDGSRMVLNTASEAYVRFDDARREVELLRGEGLFEVAKDPARAFIVRAGEVRVRAVGTVFAVRALAQDVDITVTEGVVEVADIAQGGSELSQRVSADERAVISEGQGIRVQPLARTEAERHLAWREGMVDFAGETLKEAVTEINRHNHRHIIVDDPSLAARPVVGLFRASDPDGFAATVAIALGVQRVDEGDAIHLRSPNAR